MQLPPTKLMRALAEKFEFGHAPTSCDTRWQRGSAR